MRSRQHDEDWGEVIDPTPVELPIGFKKPPTMQEMIKMYIRQGLSQMANEQGMETFEEANDFDTGEDGEDVLPTSVHEYTEMQEEELNRALKEVNVEPSQSKEVSNASKPEAGRGVEAKQEGAAGVGGSATARGPDKDSEESGRGAVG